MTELTVDSGIRTRADLLGILPRPVVEIVENGMHVATPDRCAALRVLALIRDDDAWFEAVGEYEVDAWKLIALLSAKRFYGRRKRALIQLAAQFLIGDLHVRVPMAVRMLDEDEDFLAFVDALRISREGLEA